ncbi:hypothetical protein [Streptomyces sp. NPDC002172]
MNISGLHRRLLADVLAIGTPYPLVITGGYAAQAQGVVDRLSQDIDVATENPAPMSAIADDLVRGLAERGWHVGIISVDPLVPARWRPAPTGSNAGSASSRRTCGRGPSSHRMAPSWVSTT